MTHYTDERTAKEKRALAKKLKQVEREARRKAIRERDRFTGLQISPSASYEDDAPRREPGDDNWSGFGFDLHPHVTFVSSFVLIVFILLTLMWQEEAAAFFDGAMSLITGTMGWFLILVSNLFILAALYFALSKFGHIRIGGVDAKPEFTRLGWYAMLLSAGMGIGLMFWSVGEPMYHYQTPSPMFNGIDAETPEAAQAAMGVTYFHWGIHPWAIYAIVALGLAFFAYNRGLPLTIRSVFYPLLGDKIYGFWGNVIDILSVLATLVGLATSLGLGVQQVNAGLNHLFGVGLNTQNQVILIAVITGFATMSVFAGLDAGVKRLSQLNMIMAAVLMIFLLVVGPTVYMLSGFSQNLGFYLTILPEMSLWTETFKETNWQGSWTVFYWAWWISWSPFVGMFIARISKGRTVREFIFGVIVIPTLLSFLWMSVFGGAALHLQASGVADIAAAVNDDVAKAMFAMLDNFPIAEVLSGVAVILVTVFFVTSSDSGSLVVDHLTSGGKLDSPTTQRVFWAIMEGVVAAVLLIGGGLATLQTAAVSTGLPFALVLLVGVYALYVGLNEELYVETAVTKAVTQAEDDHKLQEVVESVVQSTTEAAGTEPARSG
ncbi:glycine/betaine ABC transporter [Thiohalocapsa halophila]|uniref:Glycine/betaine ABC transporter n=1 Tax=Thiohalocapsa halophila TaxID=69359 RepID=A0ABS1CBW6_9GAMM|nr:BCCT family transporter [Thiohalocapsa halophila]MBK1629400.1 glycine/betaine ABC transporter [Thiohalocapsa halophila]